VHKPCVGEWECRFSALAVSLRCRIVAVPLSLAIGKLELTIDLEGDMTLSDLLNRARYCSMHERSGLYPTPLCNPSWAIP
jgi:hypothetical protein